MKYFIKKKEKKPQKSLFKPCKILILRPLALPRRKIAHETSCGSHHHELRVIGLRTWMSSAQESVSHGGLTPHCPSALLNAWILLFTTVICLTFLRISRECRKAFISCLISSNILGMTYLTHLLLAVVGKEESCK